MKEKKFLLGNLKMCERGKKKLEFSLEICIYYSVGSRELKVVRSFVDLAETICKQLILDYICKKIFCSPIPSKFVAFTRI